MQSLLEIESAVDRLQPNEQEKLFLFLALRLRSQGGALLEPRDLSQERIERWIEEDEAAYRQFNAPR